MFGMSGTEVIIILVLALLIFGPDKLPGLARTAGKAVRDFKKATNDIRGTVESEFYRMDEPEHPAPPVAAPVPVEGVVSAAPVAPAAAPSVEAKAQLLEAELGAPTASPTAPSSPTPVEAAAPPSDPAKT